MKTIEVQNGFIVRLERGEKLIESLIGWCEKQSLSSGWITGIGGANWAELAVYNLEDKAYEFEKIDEYLEISSLIGNISLDADKPMIHMHATVADVNYHSYAGHLKEAEIGATCELYVQVFSAGSLQRVHDENIGLKLLDGK